MQGFSFRLRRGRDWLGRFFPLLAILQLGFVLFPVQTLGQRARAAFDLSGKAVNPVAAGKNTVLIFVRSDCPISGRYAPEIQRIEATYAHDVRFFLVFPDASVSSAEIRRYLKEFAYKLPALRDPRHVLVHMAHAQVTPEAAVFDRKGGLVYHGRIDNLYEDIGRARARATTHELEAALLSVMQGAPLTTKETRAVGCYIADVP